MSRGAADPAGSGGFVKVNRHRVRDLLLQVAEILALCGDAAGAIRIIPPGHEPARLVVTLDLKGDFFHYLEPIIPYLPFFRRAFSPFPSIGKRDAKRGFQTIEVRPLQ